MTALAAIQVSWRGDLFSDYVGFVDSLGVNSAQRSQRKRAARCFLDRHGDPIAWMERPTPARLVDLHRLKAWPWLTWLMIDRRVRPDLERHCCVA